MDSQALAPWAGLILTGLIGFRSLFARLTHHGSARSHLQRAELMRQVGVDDLADADERAAREDVLRPIAIKTRGAFYRVTWLGPFRRLSWTDLLVIGLLPALLIALPTFGLTFLGLGIFVAVSAAIVIAMRWEERATDRACSSLADQYDAPATQVHAPEAALTWRFILLLLLAASRR